MAYASGNPRTKKELRERVERYKTGDGPPVRVFSPGPFGCRESGTEYVEGPHYPEPHRWYATVTVIDGTIVAVR